MKKNILASIFISFIALVQTPVTADDSPASQFTDAVGDFDGHPQSVESWSGQYAHRFSTKLRNLIRLKSVKVYDDESFVMHMSKEGTILSVSRRGSDTLNPKSTVEELIALVKHVPIESIPLKFPRDSFKFTITIIGDLSLVLPVETTKSKKTIGIFDNCHQKKHK